MMLKIQGPPSPTGLENKGGLLGAIETRRGFTVREARKKADSPCAYDPSGSLAEEKKMHHATSRGRVVDDLHAAAGGAPSMSTGAISQARAAGLVAGPGVTEPEEPGPRLRRAMPGHLAARDLRTICTGLAVPQCHDQPPGSPTSHGPL